MLYSVLTDQILLGEGYRNGAHSTLHEQLVVMFEDEERYIESPGYKF